MNIASRHAISNNGKYTFSKIIIIIMVNVFFAQGWIVFFCHQNLKCCNLVLNILKISILSFCPFVVKRIIYPMDEVVKLQVKNVGCLE